MVIIKVKTENCLESLNKKYSTRQEFDKTISETENAFMKVITFYYNSVYRY
jgi:hypothetical protein